MTKQHVKLPQMDKYLFHKIFLVKYTQPKRCLESLGMTSSKLPQMHRLFVSYNGCDRAHNPYDTYTMTTRTIKNYRRTDYLLHITIVVNHTQPTKTIEILAMTTTTTKQ